MSSSISASSSASLPASASDTAPGVVQVSILREAVQANAQLMATLLESMPVPTPDGRTGGSIDAYA